MWRAEEWRDGGSATHGALGRTCAVFAQKDDAADGLVVLVRRELAPCCVAVHRRPSVARNSNSKSSPSAHGAAQSFMLGGQFEFVYSSARTMPPPPHPWGVRAYVRGSSRNQKNSPQLPHSCGLFLPEEIPDETTLFRFRSYLVANDRLDGLLVSINEQTHHTD